MKKTRYKAITFVIIFFVIIVLLFGIYKIFNKWDYIDNDTGVISNEELLLFSTHMIDADYIGKDGDDYLFTIDKIYKGDFEETNIIHVDSLATPSITDLKIGMKYFLPLYKVMTVYHDYDNFQITGEKVISSRDNEWNSVHSLVESIIEGGRDSTNRCIGARFTRSNDIHEVIDFAQFIYVVEIGDKFSFSNEESETIAYKCKVIDVLKEPYNYSGEVVITFFKNQVVPGKKYITLVEHNEENSIMFPLSSKVYGALSMEEALKIPELVKMIENPVRRISEESFADKTFMD